VKSTKLLKGIEYKLIRKLHRKARFKRHKGTASVNNRKMKGELWV